MWVSMLGNMLPVPFIILFIRPVFAWMTRKSERLGRLAARLQARAEGKWDKVHRYQFFGPRRLRRHTAARDGAWTGALIAAVMDMRLRSALPSICSGVAAAGLIVTGITYGFTGFFA